jgi:type I restriction enzyme M protein
MMVELRRPRLDDTICDPSCGTAGFLVGAAEYLAEEYGPELVVDRDSFARYKGPMFSGYDFDGTMLRIASMNLMLHGIERPDVQQADSLSDSRKDIRDRFTLILANPPFKGSVDMDLVAEDLLKALGQSHQKKARSRQQSLPLKETALGEEKKAAGAKTELLFLAQIMGALKVGGRAAVIVPDGVLFGSSKSHVALRRMLVEEQRLEGIVSMPSGVFKPYAGVSTAVLLFVRTDDGGTDDVWFYDMTADGYSLDDKRQPVEANDIPDVIKQWRTRDTEKDTDRTARAFFVPKAEIVEQAYDLSINRYKQVQHEAVEYEKPTVLLDRLLDLEKQIQRGLEELRGMVG